MVNMDSQLQILQARYQTSLPNKRAGVELAWRALCADSSDPARIESLTRLVHRLAGSAPSYGYEEIGRLAGSADALLEQIDRVDETPSGMGDFEGILHQLTPLITRLLHALEQASSAPERIQSTH